MEQKVWLDQPGWVGWLHSHPGPFYFIALPSSAFSFYLITQDGCSSSSHDVCF